ncbi:ion channel [uncultured Winogradskyella sp.]|uniref:ion channel n=1 Tax=uncultured Winogradskyella sp. TaxID=395353 RepID=UPI003513BC57
MTKFLYPYRFELFLLTQVSILFGSLFVPNIWFENWISPILFIVNIAVGLVFFLNKKATFIFLSTLLIIIGLLSIESMFGNTDMRLYSFARLTCFFLFYAIVTLEIIKQVARAKTISRNLIFGLISGYIALGFIAFFMFLTINIIEPNSFSGIQTDLNDTAELNDKLMYFSYVTLLTIGYGEILPISDLAQKGAIMVALVGQFYVVILTAIVVGKYVNQQNN